MLFALLVGGSLSSCVRKPSQEPATEHRASTGFMELETIYQDSEWQRILGPPIGRERPVARVNGEAIKREDLDALLVQTLLARQQKRQPVDQKTIEDIRANLVSTLIDMWIQKQEAIRTRLDLDEKRVDAVYNQFRSAHKTEKEFREMLARHGETPEGFREICRNEERIRLLRNKIENTPPPKEPTEREIQEYYSRRVLDFTNVRAEQIVIEATPGMPAAEKDRRRTMAHLLYERAKAGEAFEDLVRQYSDDADSRARGGDLGGSATLSAIDPQVAEALYDRTVGYITPPLETPRGYVIFKLTEVKQIPLEALRKEIALQIKANQRMENFTRWLYSRRAVANIRILDDQVRANLAARKPGS